MALEANNGFQCLLFSNLPLYFTGIANKLMITDIADASLNVFHCSSDTKALFYCIIIFTRYYKITNVSARNTFAGYAAAFHKSQFTVIHGMNAISNNKFS